MSEASKTRKRVKLFLKGTNGIDIGCGDDKITPNCIGVDRVPQKGVNLVWDARKLPFTDNTFDWVFSSHCLEDIKEWEKTVQEWTRILKKDGYIILYMPHGDYYPKAGSELANKAHTRDFYPEEVEKVLYKYAHIVTVQTFKPPDGKYDYINRGKIEYSFLIVGRKR